MFLTPIEYCQPIFSRYPKTLVFQNPEPGAQQLLAPGAARSTRAASSWQKRSITFCVFAEALRIRMCSTSLVSARVG
jgi:hypothetical protein